MQTTLERATQLIDFFLWPNQPFAGHPTQADLSLCSDNCKCMLKMTSWLITWRGVADACRQWGTNAKLNTNHFKHLIYLLHFILSWFLLSKQISSYLIRHLTNVQINLGIFTKILVCVWSALLSHNPSSTQFNSKLQISWSILSHSLSKTPSSVLRNFSCPLSPQIHCEIAYSDY